MCVWMWVGDGVVGGGVGSFILSKSCLWCMKAKKSRLLATFVDAVNAASMETPVCLHIAKRFLHKRPTEFRCQYAQ